ncbi:MAG: c-type cytochrome [Deltaproteobacteria bacterium]|nr:c-type cytochrome [Deltaproteobacteria bacterium]
MKRIAVLLVLTSGVACRTQTQPELVSPPRASGDTSLRRRPAQPAGPAGLVASFDDGKTKVVTVVPTPNFSLLAAESVHPAVAPMFSAQFSGELDVGEAGDYQFWFQPATLTVDGQEVGDKPISLSAGKHTVAMTYRRTADDARLQLEWAKAEFFEREPVPTSAFSHVGWSDEAEAWRRVDNGRRLADTLGCRNCHTNPGDDTASKAFLDATRRGRGPGLRDAGRNLQAGWIYRWLENPRAIRNTAKMPQVLTTDDERRNVTAYLMSLKEEDGYASAGVSEIEHTGALGAEETKAMVAVRDKVGCTACHEDKSEKLSLAQTGSKFTARGLYQRIARPEWLEHSGRMPNFRLGHANSELLTRFILTQRDPALEGAVPAGDVALGRDLFLSRGCLNCHQTKVGDVILPSQLKAKPFADLQGAEGCLAPTPPPHAARYALSPEDRDDLALFLASGRNVSEAPSFELARTLESRRCNACHEIDRPAGTAFDDKPPALGDVGNKLRPDWIRLAVTDLHNNRPLRPWMSLRMPHFHGVEHIGDWFASVAGAERRPQPVAAPEPALDRQVQEGAALIGQGEGGLSCVTCHRFGEFDPKSATPAPNLVSVVTRIRPEWFGRWLRDPLRVTPGTQMPAYFAGVDPEWSHTRIASLWTALSRGANMPTPIGVDLSNAGIVLVPQKTPMVMRTFIAGGTARSIAVGFPGGPNYAYDAESCRLQFIWNGGFVDMDPAWNGRGGEEARLLGERFFIAKAGAFLSALDGQALPMHFRGYSLDKKGIPSFDCTAGTISVHEKLVPIKAGAGHMAIERQLELGGVQTELRFAIGDSATSTVTVTGAPVENGLIVIRPSGKNPVRFTIRITDTLPVKAAASLAH